MGPREFHYRWEWRLRSSPEELWPLVADTNRFNRDAGVPALDEGEVRLGGRRLLRLSKLGLPIEWEEEPFEWIRPHRFSVVRRYVRGPLDEMRVAAELRPEQDGTVVVYEVWARPRNLFGRLAIPLEIGRSSQRRFEEAFRRYDAQSASRRRPLAEKARLAPRARGRLDTGRSALLAGGMEPELADRLTELLERADDLSLGRLRPYALAEAWGAERRPVLELFLHATRCGLLELRWDLLCPLCRGPQQRAGTLAEVETDLHCDSCAIDFRADFARSVELTFRPTAAIREVEERQFCVGGPQVTPHVVAQQLVQPGEERILRPALGRGSYRLRIRDLSGELRLLATAGGRTELQLRAGDEGLSGEDELALAQEPKLWLVNETGREQLFVLERTAWSDQAVTAAEVTTLQVFRDLFAQEALRPGEPISVGTLTVLFTDLRDSTRFYREIGDAPAFGSVMDHLDVLGEAVAAEGGAVVKVMGDAILAVFGRPIAAVRAALEAQRSLADPPGGGRPLLLKVGVHTGPCIAVTQNDRLDYFGSTVNLAARLVALSSGRDVVVSSAVTSDPEVVELLEETLSAEPLDAILKGFEQEPFEMWALTAAYQGDRAALASD
jgi:class 3 adenylate cyclase